jgi:hypothetical protein
VSALSGSVALAGECRRRCSAPQQSESAGDRVGDGIDADTDGGVHRDEGSTRDEDGLAAGHLDTAQF